MLQTAARDTDFPGTAAAPTHEAAPTTIPGPELTIIVPTRNEHDNVLPVYEALCRALQGIDWETIFIDDDSQDGTLEAVCRLAKHDVGCAAFSASAAAGSLLPASRESWRAPRLMWR
jgi:hypothetical protein